MHFIHFYLSLIFFFYPASKQILLPHTPSKKDQEMFAKKKLAPGSQRINKTRPGSSTADTSQLILEDDAVTVPTQDDNPGMSQQVYLHLN